MATFQREAPSQRRHYRINTPITIAVDGKPYTAADWSLGGFRLTGFEHAIAVGQPFDARVMIDFQGFDISFRQKARVVRYDEKRCEMAAQFEQLEERNEQLLRYFGEALLSGEMTNVQGTIQRIDIPVTPVKLDENIDAQQIPMRRTIRRACVAAVYLLVGGAFTFYILLTLYSNFIRLEVDTGVMAAPVEKLRSPADGKISEVAISVNQSVRAGRPLVVLENAELTEEIELARLRVEETRVRLQELKDKIKAENSKMEIYARVGRSRLMAARDKVSGLRKQFALARKEYQRKQRLKRTGTLSRSELEAEELRLTVIEDDLKLALRELQIAKDALAAVSEGRFFSEDQVEGSLPELQAELEATRQRVQLEGQKLVAVLEKRQLLTLRAPFDGRLVHLAKSAGNTVQQGEPLALLEKSGIKFIEAYLTQSEVSKIGLGSEALVYVPAIDLRQKAVVVKIDRTEGFLDEMQSRYRWRATRDRSAIVTLKSVPGNSEPIDVPSGYPVTVSFNRAPVRHYLKQIPVVGGLLAPEKKSTLSLHHPLQGSPESAGARLSAEYGGPQPPRRAQTGGLPSGGGTIAAHPSGAASECPLFGKDWHLRDMPVTRSSAAGLPRPFSPAAARGLAKPATPDPDSVDARDRKRSWM